MNARAGFAAALLVACAGQVWAAEPEWVQVPPNESPLDRATTVAAPAARVVVPKTAQQLGDLVARIDSPELREGLWGEPKRRGERKTRWVIGNVEIDVRETPSAVSIELDRKSDDALPPSVAALPFAAEIGRTCLAAAAELGRPTWQDATQLVYVFRRGPRTAQLILPCLDTRRLTLELPRTGLVPDTQVAARREPEGTAYEKVRFAVPAEKPRTIENPWPFGLAVGASWADFQRLLGDPIEVEAYAAAWGFGTVVGFDGSGRAASIAVVAHDRANLAFARVPGREVGWLGASVGALEKVFGQATSATDEERVWVFRNDREIVTLSAELAVAGTGTPSPDLVKRLRWERSPPTRKEILHCQVNLLAAPTTPSPADHTPAYVFGSDRPEVAALIARPWGIRPDHLEDVVRVLGRPLRCDGTIIYPGIVIGAGSGALWSIEITSPATAFIAAKGLSWGPLEVLDKDDEAAASYFGFERPGSREWWGPKVKRGRFQATVRGEPGKLELAYREEPAVDDFVTGLSLHRWRESLVKLLDAFAGRGDLAPGVRFEQGTLRIEVAGKAWLVDRGVAGPALEALGLPWLDVVARLGRPVATSIEDNGLKLQWDSVSKRGMRSVKLLCRGAAPICDTLLLDGVDDGHRVD